MFQDYVLPVLSFFCMHQEQNNTLIEAQRLTERLHLNITAQVKNHKNYKDSSSKQEDFLNLFINPTIELLKKGLYNKQTNCVKSFVTNMFWESCKARKLIVYQTPNPVDVLKNNAGFCADYRPRGFIDELAKQKANFTRTNTSDYEFYNKIDIYLDLFSELQKLSTITELLKDPNEEKNVTN